MLAKLRPHLTYANVMATIAVFVALSTGGAYATHLVVDSSDVVDNSLTGADVRGKARTSTTAAVNGSLTTGDIAGQQAHAATTTPFIDGTLTQWDVKNGSLVGGDLANNTVGGTKVTDNSIKGTDVDEASLGQVPSALLGGLGRKAPVVDLLTCDPESETFVTCNVVEIDLPAPARVLLVGAIRGEDDLDPQRGFGLGRCVLSTPGGPIAGSDARVVVGDFDTGQVAPLTVVTPFTVGPGIARFGLACNESESPDFPGGAVFFDPRISAVALSPN